MSSSSSNNSNNSVGGDKQGTSSSSSSGSANANASSGSSGSGNSDMATAAAGAAAGGGGGGGVGGGAAIRDGSRSRVRWNDEDGGDDSYYDIDHDPQMTCLLHRLRREHATNFGNHGGGGSGIGGESGSGGGAAGSAAGDGCRVNRTRARYLLEASAGNVGLASALYWEDYLAVAERRGGDSTTNVPGGQGGPWPALARRSQGSGGPWPALGGPAAWEVPGQH